MGLMSVVIKESHMQYISSLMQNAESFSHDESCFHHKLNKISFSQLQKTLAGLNGLPCSTLASLSKQLAVKRVHFFHINNREGMNISFLKTIHLAWHEMRIKWIVIKTCFSREMKCSLTRLFLVVYKN